jgi:hypothetical protein
MWRVLRSYEWWVKIQDVMEVEDEDAHRADRVRACHE